jgi:tRNA threonylcarbamoyladenosine biosynthesis protein TsaB
MSAPLESLLLAFDTSGAVGSLAVGRGGRAICEMSLDVRGGLSGALLPAIDQAMSMASAAPADLAGIVVGAGPGSFTGLRVAGATAKGMVHALGVPLLAYSSLLATAAPYAAHPGAIGVLFDARGRDVFAACYEFSGNVVTRVAPAARTLDEAVEVLASAGASLLVGDGASRHESELAGRLSAAIVPPAFAAPRAASLLWLADRYPDAGYVESAASWEPEYLRASGAERIAGTGRAPASDRRAG